MTFRVRGTGLCGLCCANAIGRLYADDPAARRWFREWTVRLTSLARAAHTDPRYR
jgi:hypothetical protein